MKPLPRSGGIYYGWIILLLGIVGTMSAAGMTFWAITVYIPAIVDDFDAGRTEVALTFTVGNVVGAIVGPFAGRWMDSRGARETILVGSVAIPLALFVTSQAVELWQIFIGWSLVGAARPLLFPISYNWLVTRWFQERRQMALGLLTVGFGLSGAVALPLLSWAESIGDWRLVMIVSGSVILLVNGLTGFFFISDRPADRGLAVDGGAILEGAGPEPEEAGFTVREAIRTPVFWAMSLGFMLMFIGPSAVTLLQLDFFEDRNVRGAVLIISLTALFRGALRLPLGFLFGYVDRVFLLAVVVALSQSVAVIAIVASTEFVGIAIFMVLWSTFGAFVPMLEPALVSRAFGVRHYGAILGAVTSVAFWGSLVGPVGGGWLRDATGDYNIAFSIFAGALAFAAVLFTIASILVRGSGHREAAARVGFQVPGRASVPEAVAVAGAAEASVKPPGADAV